MAESNNNKKRQEALQQPRPASAYEGRTHPEEVEGGGTDAGTVSPAAGSGPPPNHVEETPPDSPEMAERDREGGGAPAERE